MLANRRKQTSLGIENQVRLVSASTSFGTLVVSKLKRFLCRRLNGVLKMQRNLNLRIFPQIPSIVGTSSPCASHIEQYASSMTPASKTLSTSS